MSESSVRCFAAIDVRPSPKVSELLEHLGRRGRSVRSERVDNLHLTLKFLGGVDSEAVPDVTEAVSATAAVVAPFEFALQGLRAFPDAERPSVVWIGVRPAHDVKHLASELERRCDAIGFPPEKRAYRPHLTVARVKGRPEPELFELLAESGETVFGTVSVTEIVLYRSELKPTGSIYTPLDRYPLGGAEA